MGRPLKTKETWYKVYIKEIDAPKIKKKDAPYIAEYVYQKALTGQVAMAKVLDFCIKTDQNYRPFFYSAVYGGEIDESKILWTERVNQTES